MPCAGNSYGNLVSFQELSQLDQHAVNLALKQYLVDGEAGRTKTVQQNSLIKALQLVLPYVPQALQEPQFAVERAVAERHPSGARRYDGCGVTNGTTCDGGPTSHAIAIADFVVVAASSLVAYTRSQPSATTPKKIKASEQDSATAISSVKTAFLQPLWDNAWVFVPLIVELNRELAVKALCQLLAYLLQSHSLCGTRLGLLILKNRISRVALAHAPNPNATTNPLHAIHLIIETNNGKRIGTAQLLTDLDRLNFNLSNLALNLAKASCLEQQDTVNEDAAARLARFVHTAARLAAPLTIGTKYDWATLDELSRGPIHSALRKLSVEKRRPTMLATPYGRDDVDLASQQAYAVAAARPKDFVKTGWETRVTNARPKSPHSGDDPGVDEDDDSGEGGKGGEAAGNDGGNGANTGEDAGGGDNDRGGGNADGGHAGSSKDSSRVSAWLHSVNCHRPTSDLDTSEVSGSSSITDSASTPTVSHMASVHDDMQLGAEACDAESFSFEDDDDNDDMLAYHKFLLSPLWQELSKKRIVLEWVSSEDFDIVEDSLAERKV